MLTKNKVLIIKLGHSETLCQDISKEVSLGDVVRTTVILNYFGKGDTVVWLCDEKAAPLLIGNPKIDKLLYWNLETSILLQRERFDMVINLEKNPGICAMADTIPAWRRCGFRLNDWKGVAEAHYHTQKVLEIANNKDKKQKNTVYWQQHLAKVIERKWTPKDNYVMAPINMKDKYEIGLNWRTGEKWKGKEWGMVRQNWYAVEANLHRLVISWQEGEKDLQKYMQWIASCRTIVTCDSLGMHLALAYRKRVIALFGSSPHQEVYFPPNCTKIVAPNGKMDNISMEMVKEAIENENRMDKTNTEDI